MSGDIGFKRQLAAYLHHKYPERSSADIGKELGYSYQWVKKWWNKNPVETKEFKDGRMGRNMQSASKITTTVERIVVRNMHGAKKVNGGFRRKLSQRKMVKKLKDKHNVTLCASTVGKILKKNGLKYSLRQKKVRLTESHMKRRLKFAKVFKILLFNDHFSNFFD